MPQAAQQPRNEDGPTQRCTANSQQRGESHGGWVCDMCTHRVCAGPAAASRRGAPGGRCQPVGDPPATAPARPRARHTAPGDGRSSVSGTACQRASAAVRVQATDSNSALPLATPVCVHQPDAGARRGRAKTRALDVATRSLVARQLRRDTCCCPPAHLQTSLQAAAGRLGGHVHALCAPRCADEDTHGGYTQLCVPRGGLQCATSPRGAFEEPAQAASHGGRLHRHPAVRVRPERHGAPARWLGAAVTLCVPAHCLTRPCVRSPGRGARTLAAMHH